MSQVFIFKWFESQFLDSFLPENTFPNIKENQYKEIYILNKNVSV